MNVENDDLDMVYWEDHFNCRLCIKSPTWQELHSALL